MQRLVKSAQREEHAHPRSVNRNAAGRQPSHQEPDRQAADIRGHVICHGKVLDLALAINVLVTQHSGHPGPEVLPAQVNRDHDDHQGREPPREGPRRAPTSAGPSTVLGPSRSLSGSRAGIAAGSRSRSRGRIAASQATTQNTPSRTDDAKRQSPAIGGVGREEQHHDRRRDCSQRGPALEDAVAQRPVATREQALGRHQGTGPVPSLEKTQQHPAGQQLVVAGDPSRGEPDRRPAEKHSRIKPARADPVGDESRDDPTDGERQPKALFELAVIFIIEVQGPEDLALLLCEACRSMYISMVASSSRPSIAQVRSATRSSLGALVAVKSISRALGTAIPGDHPFQERDDIMGKDAKKSFALLGGRSAGGRRYGPARSAPS